MKNIPIVLLGLAALSASVATAGIWSNDIPPARYQIPSVALVRTVASEDVQAECGIIPPSHLYVRACAKRLAGTGIIILPDPCPYAESGEQFARMACHEFGHINGWSGQHPE